MSAADAPRALPGSLAGEQPVWHRMSQAAGLVSPTGEVQETIFGRMTQLALSVDAVNLGQGAPGDPTPDFLIEAAHRAMLDGANQYPPPAGAPALREAIAEQRLRDWGHRVDPQDVLVTTGATEALTAAIVALAPLGTDVVVLEPYYDSYAAAAQLAGARLVPVGLDLDHHDHGDAHDDAGNHARHEDITHADAGQRRVDDKGDAGRDNHGDGRG